MNRRKLIQVLAVILFSLTFGMQCYIFIYSIKKSTIQGKKAHEETERARRNVNSINIWRGGNITASIAKFQKLLIPCSVHQTIQLSLTQHNTKHNKQLAGAIGIEMETGCKLEWHEESNMCLVSFYIPVIAVLFPFSASKAVCLHQKTSRGSTGRYVR